MFQIFENCTLCPNNCKVNRKENQRGFCKLDEKLHIAEICVHKGEEPILGGKEGVCNVFFSSCNLRCDYCQNYEISQETITKKEITSIRQAVDKIAHILCTGVNTVGFVSPTCQVPQMIAIIDLLHKRDFHPTIIYNTNAYDSVDQLKLLENYVDIYLPDFKYSTAELGKKYSHIDNYPTHALNAIKEMYRQKGNRIEFDENGIATSGLIIRHLVLPGFSDNSIECLNMIAFEISYRVYVSLMSQYFPVYKALDISELNRPISIAEYQKVLNHMQNIGLENGFTQGFDSMLNYRPDFSKDSNPFEK